MTATPAALHFDFTSPSSVVALLRLETMRTRGADITFVGIDMLGLAIAIPFSAHLRAERDRWATAAQQLDLPLGTPAWQPPTLKAHLIHQLAQEHGLAASWRRQVLHAYWVDGAAIDDDGTLTELAHALGLNAHDVAAVLSDTPRLRTLTQQMTQNRKRGIGDVPVLEVHGNFVSPHLSDPDLAALLMVGQ